MWISISLSFSEVDVKSVVSEIAVISSFVASLSGVVSNLSLVDLHKNGYGLQLHYTPLIPMSTR